MKKMTTLVISVLILILGVSTNGYSVPAYSGKIKIIQKDGTPLTIRVHGDEFFGYTTTEDGYVIQDIEGVYYYSDIMFDGSRSLSKIKANNPGRRSPQEREILATRKKATDNMYLGAVSGMARSTKMAEQATRSASFPLKGKIKSVIILASFKDLPFKVANPQAEFTAMLNSPGYSNNNGVGSARDYFLDNSNGEFDPEFIVYGPVVLPKDMKYYGENSSAGGDLRATTMIIDACKAAEEAGADFSQFDYNNDGEIDNVFVFYAGHNEAEGGGDDTIWPHKHLISSTVNLSGKKLKKYACSSEFRDDSGTDMAGIGTFTHEFGHVLGLADIYDIDMEKNGLSRGLGNYSIMSSGNYNNDGRTPPYYNAFEKYQLGWLKPVEINENKEYTLKNISESEAYIIKTSVANEYLMVEFRNAQANTERNWDKFIGDPSSSASNKGIFITHIDKSNNDAAGSLASSRWIMNGPNVNPAHECARFIFSGVPAGSPAGGSLHSPTENDNYSNVPFPGEQGVTMFNPRTAPAVAIDWAGKALKIGLEQITILENSATFVNNIGPISLSGSTNSILVSKTGVGNVTSMDIKWKESTATEYEMVENYEGESLRLAELKPNTSYEVIVESTDITEPINKTIKTLPINTEINFTTILFEHFQDRENSYFDPSLYNYNGSIDDIKWILNGEEKAIDYTTLIGRGEYNLVCEITINGKASKIYKTFKVR